MKRLRAREPTSTAASSVGAPSSDPVVETRAVRTEELDTMLALMCDAFGLPFTPARDLFYRDPYFDIEKKRVLLVDGLLVSCLTVVQAPIWIGKALVPVGGIAGVATRPTHRRRGYAGRLLLDMLSTLREQGCAFSALFPYSYDFYRRLGWERAGMHYRMTTVPSALPPYADARHVRPALPGDRADIARVYNAYACHNTGRWHRDDRRWTYLFEHIPNRVVYKHRDLEGYALYEIRDVQEDRRQIRLLEIVAATEQAQRGLLGFLAQQSSVHEIVYTGAYADLGDSGILACAWNERDAARIRIEAVPGVMFRIVDFGRCIEALRPNFAGLEGAVTLVMHDLHSPPGAPRAVTLHGEGQEVVVRAASEAANPRHRIEGDVHAWTQVLVGYHSLGDALALHRLRAFSDAAAALLDPLFPRRELFIPTADHF